jgi:hypothetical protein
MSLLFQSEINVDYQHYYATASEAELAEEAEWSEFATVQFAAVWCGEDSFD